MDFTGRIRAGDFKSSLDGRYTFEFGELAGNVRGMVAELKTRLGFSQGVRNNFV